MFVNPYIADEMRGAQIWDSFLNSIQHVTDIGLSWLITEVAIGPLNI